MIDEKIIDFLKADVKKYESEERYNHSISVYEECKYFASKIELTDDEINTLYKSAILHDIAKNLGLDKKLELCKSIGIEYIESPVLHQDIGPAYAKELYGDKIVDTYVSSAISKHTTGGDNMSICDMIIFIADYSEPTRKYDICIKTRNRIHNNFDKLKVVDNDLSKTILMKEVFDICENTIEHLKEKNASIDIRTLNTYNYMAEQLKENKH